MKLTPYTNIMIPSNYDPTANKSWKWNAILWPIWDEFQQVNEDDDSDDTITEFQSAPEGDGILYHPIKGFRFIRVF